MKKLATLSTALMLLFSIASFAEAPKETYDYDAVVTEDFEQLNKIENYVNSNNVTLDELKSEKTNLLNGVELDNSSAMPLDALPLNVPAFWWGCILGWIGLLLVYILSDNDKEQVKKAFYGCIVSSVVGVVIYFVAIAGAVATSI